MPVLNSSLPVPLNAFVGREDELRRLAAWLEGDESRLLTLTGPGGVGKTRLALEAAHRESRRFPGGVFFVDLSRVEDSALLADALCDGLGLGAPRRDALRAACEALRTRQALLVLDNFEHLVDSAGDVVRLLLQCPRVRALATSRVPLRVLGESVFRVPPMRVPRGAEVAESVELFLRRAGAHAGWSPEAEGMEAIAALCRRLDGLPLALEIAAAHAGHMSVARIAAELESDDRFYRAVLTGGTGRTQSLHSAISWSYAGLSPEAQRACRELSVFRGGFTLERALEVSGVADLPQAVEELCDRSLLQFEQSPRGPRYRMMEPIRMFASARARDAGESDSCAERHAACFLRLAIECAPLLASADQSAGLERLAAEAENLRAAMAHKQRQGDLRGTAEFGAALSRMWQIRGPYREGAERLRVAAEAAHALGDRPLLARLLSDQAMLLILQGEASRAAPLASDALGLYRQEGDRSGEARALNLLGTAADVMGSLDEARTRLEECLDIRRSMGDELGTATVLNNLALVRRKQGRADEAERMLRESLDICRRHGIPQRAAVALSNLAEIAAERGDAVRAEELYSQSTALYEEVGDLRGLATVTAGRADLARGRGDLEAARRLYLESLQLCEAVGDVPTLADIKGRMAEMTPGSPAEAPSQPGSPDAGAASPRLRVRLLGRFALEPEDPAVVLPAWTRRSHRALFQHLCLAGGRPFPREQLCELFWPHLSTTAALHALRKALSEARAVLAPLDPGGELLQATREAVRLETGSAIWVDALAFREAVSRASRAEAQGRRDEAVQWMREAERLYQGPLLPGETQAEPIEEERRRLADVHAALLLALARHAHRAEEWAEADRLAARALEADPCLEPACRLRMSALARQGRRAEALRVFDACRAALAAELDTGPSPRTLALYDQIRGLRAAV